jgi:hypothetical protein
MWQWWMGEGDKAVVATRRRDRCGSGIEGEWGSGGSDDVVGPTHRELLGEPQEGLLEVVVALGRDVKVLNVLLAVENDLLGAHL